jgi:hypothetical protein
METVKPLPVYPISGQLILGASGTVSQFPSFDAVRAYMMAHPSNAGVVWVGGESGTVAGDNGFPLEASGAGLPLEGIGRLGVLYATADVAGDKVCWILLDETPAYDDIV